MLISVLKKAVGLAVVAGGAAVAAAGVRYAGSKRINASERLGLALADVSHLREAARCSETESEACLAACAAYMINTAHQAAAGICGPPGLDAIGQERTVNGDGNVVAHITTTAHEPESRWQFDLAAPGLGAVNGSRRLVTSRFSGPVVEMRTPDTISVRFENGYSARIESDLEFRSNLLQLAGPRTRVSGAASLSDNRGNVGRLRIEPEGEVSGTVTRGDSVVGRFEGSLTGGVRFRQYPAIAAQPPSA